jgi:hypothetical protein
LVTLRDGGAVNDVPIFLDGELIGHSPLHQKLPPGKHLLEARGGEKGSYHVTIELRGGEHERMTLPLR